MSSAALEAASNKLSSEMPSEVRTRRIFVTAMSPGAQSWVAASPRHLPSRGHEQVAAFVAAWGGLLRSCEQVEEPGQARIHHRGFRNDGVKPKDGQRQRSFHTQNSKTRPVHCDEPSRQGGNEVGLGNDCESEQEVRNGQRNPPRITSPVRASSTKPWRSPVNETTRCCISQYRSRVGLSANGCLARTAMTKSSS